MIINDSRNLKEIASVLYAGGIVIFPTETVYGLLCDATNPATLLKLYQLKERPLGKSFPILVKDFIMLSEYATFSPEQKTVIVAAKEPTNFVLKGKNLSPLLMQGKTAAFRISKSLWVKKLFMAFDKPLVATSANISGEAPITDPRKFSEIFGKKANLIDGIVFSGINRKRKGSRILDITKKPYQVLRS